MDAMLPPARPFLKWAGGKTQLLGQLRSHYPPELADGRITRYAEPFLGSGAVFLDVAQRYRLDAALLTDANPEVVLAFTAVQAAPGRLVERLADLEQVYLAADASARARCYYEIRAAYNAQRPAIDFARYSDAWVDRAAWMIYLNKTCYNGLHRVNRAGAFNVPHGRYTKPAICDAANLMAVSHVLQRTELRCAPFTGCRAWVDTATFVYFDPPYRPLSATSSFTAYSTKRFDDAAQTTLACFYAELHDTTGARLMLSNADPANVDPSDCFFETLYGRFRILRVVAKRMINTRPDRRGPITELLILNY